MSAVSGPLMGTPGGGKKRVGRGGKAAANSMLAEGRHLYIGTRLAAVPRRRTMHDTVWWLALRVTVVLPCLTLPAWRLVKP